ncbi:PepSY domain-containing protein [Streptomyces millisiae]|uniref:PepSY domain-containing protein n=1 Tax=Streptomyces millisiae TaxID=3075542 RepID=A0ABU2LQ38_9ACTN|nr:PepSY domain-containing protein [Streptomyces sp. DSM 44918]MDT0319710.1 PepSY domain-containing protein [Streptomyces sp. DSM 44918]
MKRKVSIAAVAAAAVIGGGVLSAAALGGGSSGSSEATSALGTGQLVSASTDDLAVTDAETDGEDRPDDDGSDDRSSDDRSGGGAGTAAQQAAATALAERAGVVTEVDHEDDGRHAGTWEVEVFGDDGQWYQVRVSEDGAEVVDSRTDQDEDGDDQDDARTAADARVDAARAVDIALGEVSGNGTVESVSLDDGRWDVELRGDDGTEHEVSIDPASGDITAQEQDDQDDDGDDDHGDDQDDDHEDGDDD